MADYSMNLRSSGQKRRVSEMDESPSDRKAKKKRRSSFVRGRSRKSLPQTETSELHKKISKELPPEERLEQLQLLAAENAFRKLEDEFPLLDALSEIKTEAMEVAKKYSEDCKKEEKFEKACGSKKVLPNKWNQDMMEAIQEVKNYEKKIQNEGEKWDELLTIYTELADRAQSSVSEESLSDPPKSSLNYAQRKLMNDMPDLNEMLNWISDTTEKLPLQMDEIQQYVEQTDQFEKCTQMFISSQIKALESSSSGASKKKDPKEIMQKMLKLK